MKITKKQIIISIAVLAIALIVYFKFFRKKEDEYEQKKAFLRKVHDAGWYSLDTTNFPPAGTKIPPFETYNTPGMGFMFDGFKWEVEGENENELTLKFIG